MHPRFLMLEESPLGKILCMDFHSTLGVTEQR